MAKTQRLSLLGHHEQIEGLEVWIVKSRPTHVVIGYKPIRLAKSTPILDNADMINESDDSQSDVTGTDQ